MPFPSKANVLPGHGRRVLIIVENLPVPFDRRVWSEATTLVRNGYEVSVICPKGHGAEKSREEIDGIHIYRHWLPEAEGMLGYLVEYGVALFWEFVLSLRILMTRGFDAIHACNPPDLIFLVGMFHKFLFGKKFLFDHHDLDPELYEAKFCRRGFIWNALVFFERCTYALADIAVVTNASYRAIALDRGGKTADRVFIVRSGPNLDRLRTVPADERWKFGQRFLVTYVGVIGRQEGLDLLLDSVAHTVHRRSDVQFVIVGDGPELKTIRNCAHEKGLGDVITFTGRVNDHTLLTILSTADVCVNPDRPNVMNDKSTMNKIMEYMAMGKPIVQFDLQEGRVSAGEASLYARNTDTADFAEKILQLLDDPRKRAQMGALGHARIQNDLAWKYEEPKLLAAYAALFEAAPSKNYDADAAAVAPRAYRE